MHLEKAIYFYYSNKLQRRQHHNVDISYTRFCTAGGDKKLRCFSVDLKNNSTVQMLDGHESYINDCVFNPVQGDVIASVSGMYMLIVLPFYWIVSENIPNLTLGWEKCPLWVGYRSWNDLFYISVAQTFCLGICACT